MWTLALSFFTKNWKLLVVAAAIGGAYLYVQNLRSTVNEQREQIATLQLENQIIKENNVKLEAALTASNQAIGKLAEGAAQTKKDFATLNTNVRSQSTKLEERLRQILAEKKPETCEATIDYLIDAVKEYQR